MTNPPRQCAKCGSEGLFPARVTERDEGRDFDLKLRVDANPHALMFKEAWRSPLRAIVCSKCGFTELYVEDPAQLCQAHLQAGRNA